jgi:hypothetical protein
LEFDVAHNSDSATRIETAPRLFGPPDVVAVRTPSLTVARIGKAQADDIIRRNHYSRAVVWSSSIHLGVFAGADLIGAIQYGPAMNPASGGTIVAGTTPELWLELNRLWLADEAPRYAASQAIAASLRLVRSLRPRVEWIQTFADSRCRKLGGVYQACSFVYVGCHTSTFYRIDDVWVHRSLLGRAPVDSRGWGSGPKAAWVRANQHRAVAHEVTQYRYLKFLNRGARRRLLLPALPYPKPDETEKARSA